MMADIVTEALIMAWLRRRPVPGLLLPFDRGSPYASPAFQDKLRECGMTCLMSGTSKRWDNAPAKSRFNNFKNQRVQGMRDVPPCRHASGRF